MTAFFLFIFYPVSALAATISISPGDDIQNAVAEAGPGSNIIVHGGIYTLARIGGIQFYKSDITFSNYTGEQVIIKNPPGYHDNDWSILRCWHTPPGTGYQNNPVVDNIKILGSDVNFSTLPNGAVSNKGIVLYNDPGEENAGVTSGIESSGCNNWEVSGIDFVGLGYGIFQKKWLYSYSGNDGSGYATHGWNIHDNRVYGFTRESGFQFNGNYNTVQNNQIYKIINYKNSPYGCQLIDILGHHNIIKNNILSALGSGVTCNGILFEWDVSDQNLVENNIIFGTSGSSVNIQGGDNNIIRNNQLSKGINIFAPEGSSATSWPCDELQPGNSSASILPADIPSATDYQYFYNPRECASRNNITSSNITIPDSGPSSATLFPTSGPDKPADANGDGKVDGVDYIVWLNHYGQNVTGAANGNFNGNNVVDGVDYIVWLNNYGK